MIDVEKLQKSLQTISSPFFRLHNQDLSKARQLWDLFIHQQEVIQQKLAQQTVRYLAWQGDIAVRYPFAVTPLDIPYAVIAVDGSQIYSDRHMGCSWSLINIGVACITYARPCGRVALYSEPHVSAPDTMAVTTDDFIDARRTVLEFQKGIELLQSVDTEQALLLVDGTLSWGLGDTVDPVLVACYEKLLQTCVEQKLPIAAYCSAPHNRDLVKLLSLVVPQQSVELFASITDSDVASWFLLPETRSVPLGLPQGPSKTMPLCVVYAHIGYEIVRIEIPEYIAFDEKYLQRVVAIIGDQVTKGYGYPVCLAEAHEQALVTEADRMFFYACVQQHMPRGNTMVGSRKSMRKREALV